MKRLAIAAAALAALAALVATLRTEDAAAVDPAADSRGITVQGTASVSAAPDEAGLSFGVETRADSARAALAANGTAMRKVIAALRAAGGRELQTQSVWLNSFHGENGPQGFVATNSVSTTVDIGKVGALIDAAVNAGANQVSGPSMSVADRQELYRQALKAAVADARERAEALADAAGGSLGTITTIVEGGSAPMPVAMERGALASDAATPIEPGEQKIEASVSVTFALA
jgi:uncharacterized protein YggE